MKKKYARPMIIAEEFACNEYVAACEDTENEYYKFVCDAGGGATADIYEGTYPDGNLLTSDFIVPLGYHACGVEHYVKVDDTSPFVNGWYDSNYADWGQKYEFDVTIWKGPNNNNVHATRALTTQIEIIKGNKS